MRCPGLYLPVRSASEVEETIMGTRSLERSVREGQGPLVDEEELSCTIFFHPHSSLLRHRTLRIQSFRFTFFILIDSLSSRHSVLFRNTSLSFVLEVQQSVRCMRMRTFFFSPAGIFMSCIFGGL